MGSLRTAFDRSIFKLELGGCRIEDCLRVLSKPEIVVPGRVLLRNDDLVHSVVTANAAPCSKQTPSSASGNFLSGGNEVEYDEVETN